MDINLSPRDLPARFSLAGSVRRQEVGLPFFWLRKARSEIRHHPCPDRRFAPDSADDVLAGPLLGRITASMSEPDPRPFSGLFDLTSPGVGRDLNRRFVEADLNDSVRSLVAYLDRVFSVATDPGWVFLTTIENDAVAGRFPEVLRNFFDWEPWSDSTRYFVAPMGQLTVEPEAVVGRITFESPPGHLIQVLAYNDGFCWGANLSVGGVQVREGDVTQAVALNPFSVDDARQLESLARLAWAASRDLDEFGLNASAGHEHLLARLDQIRTA